MKIVVAVDGSLQSLAAVSWIAQLSLSPADEIVLVSVAQQPALIGAWGYAYTDVSLRLQNEAWDAARELAGQAVADAARELTRCASQVRTAVLDGHPIDVISELVRETEADLVVVGPHGHGRLASVLLGSVSQSLLHRMPTSVLVAREPVRPPERILLAVDGSAHGLAAARYLARFPLPAGSQITVLTSIGAWPDHAVERGAADLRDTVIFERGRAAEIVAEAIEALEAGGRTSAPLIRHGDPKRQILAAATEIEADLIVTGARGIGGFRGLVLGSVSRAVSKAAPCSTLVVAGRASREHERSDR